jgi:hypothetical protein
MIGINLLPGTGRKVRRSSGGGGMPKLDIGAKLAALRDRVREPWLLGAVGATALAVAAVGVLYVSQTRREAALDEAVQKAVQDSTRYASVLRERETAEAKRDTVLRSLNLIRAIDDDRFIWPHVMDEVSRALPPYTWIVSLGFTGTGQAQQAVTTCFADGHRARYGAHPRRRQHSRHPGADALHEATRIVALPRAGAARQVRARQ